MKVKDFIEFIRPITAVNPDTELKIINSSDEFEISHLYISNDGVTICFIDPFSDK